MSRVTRILVWLLFGHAVIGGLYWALIQVPESTVWMLALSTLLVVLIVVVAATVEATAIWWWQDEGGDAPVRGGDPLVRSGNPLVRGGDPLVRGGGASAPPSWARRVRHTLALPSLGRSLIGFALAAIVFVALYALTGRIDAWWSSHRGEIDAWLMMRARSPRTRFLNTLVEWVLWFVRYPVALSLAVGLFGAALQRALRPRPLGWVREALHWRPLLGLTLALLVFFVLPWRFVYWRPESLPPTWVEPLFVGAKLFAVYALMNAGWTIVLSAGARQVR